MTSRQRRPLSGERGLVGSAGGSAIGGLLLMGVGSAGGSGIGGLLLQMRNFFNFIAVALESHHSRCTGGSSDLFWDGLKNLAGRT